MRPVRNPAIDGIKTVAILGTLFIHASAAELAAGEAGSLNWTADLFWASFLRCAVPLFFMCSGALFLAEEKQLPLSVLWRKYILRIAAALAFWSLAYCLWNRVVLFPSPEAGRLAGVKAALLDWICFRHKYHLYYLVVLLAVYAVLPLTRLIVRKGDPALLRYVMLLWFLCGSLLPLLFSLPPLSYAAKESIYLRQYALTYTGTAVGFGMAGHFLLRGGGKRAPGSYVLLYLAGLAVTCVGTLLTTLRAGELSAVFIDGSAPGVVLQAMGLFGLIAALCGRGRRLPRWTETVSRASFCIYLVHPFFLDMMARAGFTAETCSALWAVPVQVVLLFLAGMACWAVLKRIPVVNKYLI